MFPLFPHLYAMKWWDLMPILVFWMLSFIVVIDISPWNLDSSLCFIQPNISHDVLYIS